MSRPTGAPLALATPLALAATTLALATAGCGTSATSRPASASSQSANAPNGSPSGSSQPDGSGAQAAPGKLLATVSAMGQVTLTDSGGRPVTRLHSGWYTIFVTVNTAGADFHLTGPSVDSATKTKIPGVALWGIHFVKGTYRYTNDRDAHAGARILSVY